MISTDLLRCIAAMTLALMALPVLVVVFRTHVIREAVVGLVVAGALSGASLYLLIHEVM